MYISMRVQRTIILSVSLPFWLWNATTLAAPPRKAVETLSERPRSSSTAAAPLSAPPTANAAPQTTGTPGAFAISMDAPSRITPSRPFDLRVTYSVTLNRDGQPFDARVMRVFTDNTADMHYKPREFVLPPNTSTIVSAVADRTQSGLAQVLIAGDHYHNVQLTLDEGFRGRVDWHNEEPLESGTGHWRMLNFVDNQDRPIALDAPIVLRLTTGNARIRPREVLPWSDRFDIVVPKGATDAGPFEMEPTPMAGAEGTLEVRGYLDESATEALFDRVLTFDILPPMWIRLGVTILGALVYSIYGLSRSVQRSLHRDLIQTLTSAAFAGVLAWALADWNVLGIRIDSARLTGYFVLGLVTSYAGVEPVLTRLVQRRERRREQLEEPDISQNDESAGEKS